ncbi:MAG: hypothetical protein AAGA03_18885 [Planctomycetota bacterium]
MLKKTISVFAIVLIAGLTVVAGEIDLKDVKCVVAPKAAKLTQSADYKDAKVYFCCGNCEAKFKKDSSKFATKANHQLVTTKQYKQTACPFSGGDVNPETMIKVSGTEVGFCCNNCKGRAEKAKGKEQMEMIFADKAFKKGFKLAKAEK